ncbi:MAG: polysaccharide biosynthesis protein [Archangiaceae bacterium]|nr:polysaccharide biosynthesis protein [Archangiaceae bacterium]
MACAGADRHPALASRASDSYERPRNGRLFSNVRHLAPRQEGSRHGGTGSFGNFIVHRMLNAGAAEVRVFSRDEKKQYDMNVFYAGRKELTFVIGDVRSRDALREAVRGVNVVFHASALKHVSKCETHPSEAIQTNVLGAQNVVDVALEEKVEACVAISTDKAVKPVNVMGMTKALMERTVLAGNLSRRNNGTRFGCVRYGNVLRSRGSVIPFFRRQLSMGKKLTITHESMTRFLLTLNDAIDLVLYAAHNASGGDIFVRKAPSARIVEMARVLSEEAGKPLTYDVVGVLPGEKFDEILLSEEELPRTEDLGDYYRVHPWWSAKRPAAVNKEFSSGDYLVDAAELKRLIARADKEFESMEISGSEFSKF